MKKCLFFVIAVLCLCSACNKEANIEADKLLIGKWQFEKVEYYELSESGEPVFINAESEPEYKALNQPHSLEFTDTHAMMWIQDKYPESITTYTIFEGFHYWKDNKGVIYTDYYLLDYEDVFEIYILNKTELALILTADELEFGSSNWEEYHHACPVMFYKRIK